MPKIPKFLYGATYDFSDEEFDYPLHKFFEQKARLLPQHISEGAVKQANQYIRNLRHVFPKDQRIPNFKESILGSSWEDDGATKGPRVVFRGSSMPGPSSYRDPVGGVSGRRGRLPFNFGTHFTEEVPYAQGYLSLPTGRMHGAQMPLRSVLDIRGDRPFFRHLMPEEEFERYVKFVQGLDPEQMVPTKYSPWAYTKDPREFMLGYQDLFSPNPSKSPQLVYLNPDVIGSYSNQHLFDTALKAGIDTVLYNPSHLANREVENKLDYSSFGDFNEWVPKRNIARYGGYQEGESPFNGTVGPDSYIGLTRPSFQFRGDPDFDPSLTPSQEQLEYLKNKEYIKPEHVNQALKGKGLETGLVTYQGPWVVPDSAQLKSIPEAARNVARMYYDATKPKYKTSSDYSAHLRNLLAPLMGGVGAAGEEYRHTGNMTDALFKGAMGTAEGAAAGWAMSKVPGLGGLIMGAGLGDKLNAYTGNHLNPYLAELLGGAGMLGAEILAPEVVIPATTAMGAYDAARPWYDVLTKGVEKHPTPSKSPETLRPFLPNIQA
jgi:hypothetical protein